MPRRPELEQRLFLSLALVTLTPCMAAGPSLADAALGRGLVREHVGLVVVLAIVAMWRLWVLVSTAPHVHSDEAVIGLMAKHVSEGGAWPLYMWGQPYAAFASFEAIAAALIFAAFGAGALQLKATVVALSLTSVAAVYLLARELFGKRTALWSTAIFASLPALARWPFQVTGYSFYFLAVPLLTWALVRLARGERCSAAGALAFGAGCGVAVFGLELAAPSCALLLCVFAIIRRSQPRAIGAAVVGVVVGYAPALVFNATHAAENWRCVWSEKLVGGAPRNEGPWQAVANIFARELPRAFGTDTTLWFYGESTWIGWASYAAVAVALAVFAWPLARRPGAARNGGELAGRALVLAGAWTCFATFCAPSQRMPPHLLGAMAFFAIAAGHVMARAWTSSRPAVLIGGSVALALAASGAGAQLVVARANYVETLAFTPPRPHMQRFPGADLEAVLDALDQQGITDVNATPSFVYPLIFESAEQLAVSGAWAGWTVDVYPRSRPRVLPRADQRQAYVLERDSHAMKLARELGTKRGGRPPTRVDCGTLTVLLEARGN